MDDTMADMAEIVKLGQVRKQRAKDARTQEATENRARYGRTKVQKQNEEKAQARLQGLLDDLRRDARQGEE